MLEGNGPTLLHVAYQTLRFSMSLPSSDMLHLQSWPTEYRVELEYLQGYPRSPRTRPARNLRELSSPAFDPDITVNFCLWIAKITILLSDLLVALDPFYAQITPSSPLILRPSSDLILPMCLAGAASLMLSCTFATSVPPKMRWAMRNGSTSISHS